MSNENAEILAAFVAEANENLADIENDFLLIEAGGADIDADLVNKVFRAIHSMKGTAGYLGLKSIGSLAHQMEDILNKIRGNELVPNSPVVDALLKGADALRDMVNDVETSNDVDVSALINALTASAAGGEVDQPAQDMPDRDVDITLPNGQLAFMMISVKKLLAHQKEGASIYVVELDFITDLHDKDKTPLEFLQQLNGLGVLIDSYANPAEFGSLDQTLTGTLPLTLLLASPLKPKALAEQLQVPEEKVFLIASPDDTAWGEEPVTTSEPAETATEDTTTPAADQPEGPAAEQPSQPEPNQAASAPKPAKPVEPQAAAPAVRPEANLRVNVKVLDTLMNLAGELVLGRNQLLQVISAKDYEGIDSVAARMDQVTSELQEAIMQTRMQPVGTVFNKFPRVIRDLSSALGKQCDLSIRGKDVELDKTIIEAIGDPLTHLIRNSVDHGIEAPDVRIAKGKPEAGQVELRAFHQAGKVNISIQDDGAGIDANKLRQKAVEKDLISADKAREMSDREAVHLIFHPGFSTAEQVTDVSGRGVGMDVVKTNITKLGGTIAVDTEVGFGSTFHIKLPLTLAIIPSLIVRCGHGRYAIPQVNISELVRIKPSEAAKRVERVKNAEVLRLRGSLLPLVRLSDALDVQPMYIDPKTHELVPDRRRRIADQRLDDGASDDTHDERHEPDERRDPCSATAVNVIVVETGHLRYGLIVDGLFDSQEIVVKPLGRHMKDIACLAGATILGDGKVAPILDVAGIANHMSLAQPDAEESAARPDDVGGEATGETQAIILFTNDPHEYFGVPTGLISRIERIRSDQIDTIGGQEVLQYRGASLPLLSLSDHIKAKPRPETTQCYVVVFSIGKQDIGLIVPDLVDIREVSTDIDSTTFREPGVVGSLVIGETTTRLLDLFELAGTAHPEWTADLKAKASGNGQARLLLAEDSTFFRNHLESFLGADGHEVVACEDGLVAWNALQDSAKPFDLVVTDIEMPNMDGYELARKIRADERFADLPIIAVTSLAGESDRERGFKAGVNEYQVKLDREQLKQVIAKYIHQGDSKAHSAATKPVGDHA